MRDFDIRDAVLNYIADAKLKHPRRINDRSRPKKPRGKESNLI